MKLRKASTEFCTKGAIRVFVYGTLRKAHGNNVLLKDSRYVGSSSVTVPGKLISLGGFPGVVSIPGGPEKTIFGEVYEVNEDTLNALDWLESHPRFYERHKVKTDDGIRCWLYMLPDAAHYDQYEVIRDPIWNASGDEREFWAIA